jgi:hypothetical protein
MTQPADSTDRRRDLISALVLSLGVKAQDAAELPKAVDVVVVLDASGVLDVSGRAIKEPLQLRSVEELRALLHTLATPGTGLVYTSFRVEGAGHDIERRRADMAAAEREVRAALQAAGFSEVRSGNKSFF